MNEAYGYVAIHAKALKVQRRDGGFQIISARSVIGRIPCARGEARGVANEAYSQVIGGNGLDISCEFQAEPEQLPREDSVVRVSKVATAARS